MANFTNPNHALGAQSFMVVSVSCSTSTSAAAAGVGPFRGLFFITSSSVTITGNNGNTISLDNITKNTFVWIEGAFLSAIATATAVYALR